MKRNRRIKQDAKLADLLAGAAERIKSQASNRDQLLSKLRATAQALRGYATKNRRQGEESGMYATQIAAKARADAYESAALRVAALIEDFE